MNSKTTSVNREPVMKIAFGAASILLAAGAALGQATERINTSSAGVQGSTLAYSGCITPDGRWVCFTSGANNLVANDNNSGTDVFVKDRRTGVTVRVSVPDFSTGHTDANASCFSAGGVRTISDNGRFVVFASNADNLVNGDSNPLDDVFVRDRDLDGDGVFDEPGAGQTRTTRVNLTSSEGQATDGCPNSTCSMHSYTPCISASGRYVAWSSGYNFTSGAPDFDNIYVRDRDPDVDGIMDETNALTILASPEVSCMGCSQNGSSFQPTISADGRYVAFLSNSRYITYSDYNDARDAFVRDIIGNHSWRASIDSDETDGQADRDVLSVSISDNGRLVCFTTGNNGLGHVQGLPPDNNNAVDVFVRDLDTDADGVFEESAPSDPNVPNLPQTEGVTRTVSLGDFFGINGNSVVRLNASSLNAVISGDGRYVAYQTAADNVRCSFITCADTDSESDIYVRDLTTNTTERASLGQGGLDPNGPSIAPFISTHGDYVGFTSTATNLRGSDSNGTIQDVYLRAGVTPPESDGCNNFPQIQAGTYFDDTSGAAANGSSSCGTSDSTPDLIYHYFAGCSGNVTIDTLGSSFDTVLSVHTACPATAANEIACNDDFQAPARWSRVTIPVQAGQVYKIRISGFNGAVGPVQLNLSACTAACNCDWNHDNVLNSQDFFDFITPFFASNADFNGDGVTNSQDFFDFITCFFTGCP